MNRQLNIIDKVNNKRSKYNILTFNTHERYQTQLAKTGHNFFSFNYKDGKDWYDGHAPMPANHYQLPKENRVPNILFDMILCQSKFGQFQVAKNLNQILQIPLICLEHTLPLPNWPENTLNHFKTMTGDFNVFITEYSKDQWGMPGDVIPHSVDVDLFKPNDKIDRSGVLTVAHDFIERDYALNYHGWERITQGLDRKVVGDTEGLSKQSESVTELVKTYQEASVYINPSVLSPVPTSMLEAMACGCAVVTTSTCEIPRFIKNGENGFMSNDESELRKYIEMLLENPAVAQSVGQAARRTIMREFSEKKFKTKWNEIFNQAYREI